MKGRDATLWSTMLEWSFAVFLIRAVMADSPRAGIMAKPLHEPPVDLSVRSRFLVATLHAPQGVVTKIRLLAEYKDRGNRVNLSDRAVQTLPPANLLKITLKQK